MVSTSALISCCQSPQTPQADLTHTRSFAGAKCSGGGKLLHKSSQLPVVQNPEQFLQNDIINSDIQSTLEFAGVSIKKCEASVIIIFVVK